VGLSSFNAFKHLPFKSFPRHKINIYIHINFENTLTAGHVQIAWMTVSGSPLQQRHKLS
jgi:hypothetical protein